LRRWQSIATAVLDALRVVKVGAGQASAESVLARFPQLPHPPNRRSRQGLQTMHRRVPWPPRHRRHQQRLHRSRQRASPSFAAEPPGGPETPTATGHACSSPPPPTSPTPARRAPFRNSRSFQSPKGWPKNN